MPELHELRPFSLRDRSGRILFTDYDAQSIGDAMAAYVDHLDHVTKTNRNLNVHREVLREVGEVIHAHAHDFARAQHVFELDDRLAEFPPSAPTPGGVQGLVARMRTTVEDRATERERQSVQARRNVLAHTMPDATQVLEAAQTLEEMRATLYTQARLLRERDIGQELDRSPEWLSNTLGPRPNDQQLAQVWDETARGIAARRVDLRITEPESHGLPSNQRHLLTAIADTRVELGLDAPAPAAADRELCLSLT